jgi:uncharacterized protein YkwD
MLYVARAAAGSFLAALILLVPFANPAAAASCPAADSAGGSATARAAAMRCLISDLRVQAHRPALRGSAALTRSATAKAAAIARCQNFAHTPCGVRGSTSTCYSLGENLAQVSLGATPREVLRAWVDSPAHRANLLSTGFRDTGLARRVVTIAGTGRVEVWVQHFGARCR